MSEMLPTPSGPLRYTSTQRRLLTVSAGLGVAVLAGVAFVVTYGDLRALVVEGHAPRRLAPAYPVMFDVLITVTILALVVARNSRWWNRWPRWLLLIVLLAGAAAASVQRATKGYAALPDEALKAGTAVAPHVMLLLAIWLWLAMFRQARAALARRTAPEGPPPGQDVSPVEDTPADRADLSGTGPGHEPEHQPGGELTDDPPHGDPQDPTWQNPWPPKETALDWALVPYDHEPAPSYEPDPAVRPYEPDPVRPYEPEPVQAYEPEPVQAYEPEPVQAYEADAVPDSLPGSAGDEQAASSAAPSTLPTDVKLVGRPAATTQPDLLVPSTVELGSEPAAPVGEPYAEPVRVPASRSAADEDEDGADVPVTDRAEDPDAGDDQPVGGHFPDPDQPSAMEWRPPSSTFRSSPTPPDG